MAAPDIGFAGLVGGSNAAAEVDSLQTKLTRQMAYCTQLSKHAHDLEQRAALHATELREKTKTLRSALESLDALRTEKKELVARLHKAESTVAMISTEVCVLLPLLCLLFACVFSQQQLQDTICTLWAPRKLLLQNSIIVVV